MQVDKDHPLHGLSSFAIEALEHGGWQQKRWCWPWQQSPASSDNRWAVFVKTYSSSRCHLRNDYHPARQILDSLFGAHAAVHVRDGQTRELRFSDFSACDSRQVVELGDVLDKCLLPVAEIPNTAQVLVAEDQSTFLLGVAEAGVLFVSNRFADAINMLLRFDDLRPVFFSDVAAKEQFELPGLDPSREDIYWAGST